MPNLTSSSILDSLNRSASGTKQYGKQMSKDIPTGRAHLLLLIAQISWANDNGCRWAVDQYFDPSHPAMLTELRSKGYNDAEQFEKVLDRLGYISDEELLKVATAMLENPPF
jgi:hypothetical protein